MPCNINCHACLLDNLSHLLFIDDQGFYVEKVMNDDRVRLRNFCNFLICEYIIKNYGIFVHGQWVGGPVANTGGLATTQRGLQQFLGPHIYTLTPGLQSQSTQLFESVLGS